MHRTHTTPSSEDIFFIQTYPYPEVWCNRHAAALFKTGILEEDRMLYSL